MADKKDDKKKYEKKTSHKHSSGEMSFGLQIILFIVAIFIIWVLMGKPQSENVDKPFIKADTTTTILR